MKPALSLLLLFSVLFGTGNAWAGANAGGTLLVHSPGIEYTVDNDGYCDDANVASCDSIVARTDASSTVVWLVYAVFAEVNQPRLRGVEFGVSYSGVGIVDHAMCGDLEQVIPGWPASGTGTIMVWNTTYTERLVPVYWFAGYVYSASGASGAHFSLGPHPVNGGHFGDDSLVPVLDTIAGYGSLGFYSDGEAPCPAPRTFLIRADGTGDVATIQDAVDIAAPTSVIQLADGVYRGDGNRDIHLNQAELTIRSISDNPEACVIDCEGTVVENHRAFVVHGQEVPATRGSTIQGIKVINAYATADAYQYDSEGGGLRQGYGSMLRIENCVFQNCFSDKAGGAVDCAGGTLDLIDCVFRDNVTATTSGGALSADSSPILMRGCVFDGNRVGQEGGAFRLTNCTVAAEDCLFRGNSAVQAGGTSILRSSGSMTRCSWVGNTGATGGAIIVLDSDLRIERATVSDNRGSGASIHCSGTSTRLELNNSIVSFSALGPAVSCGTAEVLVSGSDIFGNQGGDWTECLASQLGMRGNFSLDPLYCDRPGLDYHLYPNSPCATRSDVLHGPVGAWGVGCRAVRPHPADRNTPEPSPLVDLRLETNPFIESTRIGFALQGDPVRVEVAVYDLQGRRIRTLMQAAGSGSQSVLWNGRDDRGTAVPSGIYLCRITAGSWTKTFRLLRIR